jgi:hypothetical protein
MVLTRYHYLFPSAGPTDLFPSAGKKFSLAYNSESVPSAVNTPGEIWCQSGGMPMKNWIANGDCAGCGGWHGTSSKSGTFKSLKSFMDDVKSFADRCAIYFPTSTFYVSSLLAAIPPTICWHARRKARLQIASRPLRRCIRNSLGASLTQKGAQSARRSVNEGMYGGAACTSAGVAHRGGAEADGFSTFPLRYNSSIRSGQPVEWGLARPPGA